MSTSALRWLGPGLTRWSTGAPHREPRCFFQSPHAIATLIGDFARRTGLEFIVEYSEEAIGFIDRDNHESDFLIGFFGAVAHIRRSPGISAMEVRTRRSGERRVSPCFAGRKKR